MKPSTENWLRIAKYDLKTAEVTFKAGQYLACVEKCHNALEKLLKGILQEQGKSIKKIHDLLALASEAVIGNLQQDLKQTLDELNDCYMHTRYPDEFIEMEQEISKPKSKDILTRTKKIFIWLEKSISN